MNRMEVNIHEAKTQLSRLIVRALAGEEVTISKAGKPLVRLTPIERNVPVLGSARGMVTYKEGWDEPMSPAELADWEDGEVFPK
jgi:prevent-host-death family protein